MAYILHIPLSSCSVKVLHLIAISLVLASTVSTLNISHLNWEMLFSYHTQVNCVGEDFMTPSIRESSAKSLMKSEKVLHAQSLYARFCFIKKRSVS